MTTIEKRKILLGDGTAVVVTFEQMLERFDMLIDKYAYSVINSLHYNKPELADVRQQMLIHAWKAFTKYNSSIGAFSTYLVFWLRSARSNMIRKIMAEKRSNMLAVSMNNKLDSDEGGETFEKFLSVEDEGLDEVDYNESIREIYDALTDREKILFKFFVDKENNSVQSIGDELGVSRQYVNSEINKLKKRLQKQLELKYLNTKEYI